MCTLKRILRSLFGRALPTELMGLVSLFSQQRDLYYHRTNRSGNIFFYFFLLFFPFVMILRPFAVQPVHDSVRMEYRQQPVSFMKRHPLGFNNVLVKRDGIRTIGDPGSKDDEIYMLAAASVSDSPASTLPPGSVHD